MFLRRHGLWLLVTPFRARSPRGRPVLYSLTHSSSVACSSGMVANRWSAHRWSALVKNSARIVLCRRSTFPVVVGEYGALSKCVILYPRRSGRK